MDDLGVNRLSPKKVNVKSCHIYIMSFNNYRNISGKILTSEMFAENPDNIYYFLNFLIYCFLNQKYKTSFKSATLHSLTFIMVKKRNFILFFKEINV